ncbi:tripartite tricarboxylate transporter permease [Paracoccus fistulariae]|uniref:Tripartite tricarboxylate transporter permease n=1 Tax=Paracoccus fistulariae TaxID=658446 RepID=A0ABY7SPZ8_9RHOB|nr:tripartite tricarboxylate transporter permease [Paracoccus fistulariae]MDB6182441.1 tripartite tricarboxylate transporter permease [Paracoccus fistulariae]WCR08588.1 tripartite tricarboxylate transporter permease [Paracoccus fistulariae]
MSNFDLLMHGFSIAITPMHLMLMVAGVLMGLVVGVLPGLGAPNGVSLLIPLTFALDPTSAIILLSSMYWGALFGGSTTSILFNIPGEPSSVATTFDGYPMAQKGQSTRALTLAFMSAGIGALLGIIVITLLAGWASNFALKFGAPEYFAVYFLAFAAFIGMGSASPAKTLVSLSTGLILSTVGMDTITGEIRLTFGYDNLLSGVSFLVVVIGLFGIGELLSTVQEGLRFRGVSSRIDLRDVLRTMAELPRYWATSLRSGLIGIWMGITPGGPTAASFMSYGIARQASRKGEPFGTGRPEGIVAPETADHSAGTCAMLPMLALGVPSSATAAVMMGGLMIWGLTPGPMLFATKPDFVWGLIASMYISNIVGVILVLATVPMFAALLRIPFAIIGPIIVAICFVGAYTVSNSTFDLWLVLVFGLVGYMFNRLDYPLAPLVLAMVLGHKAENAFHQSMVLSDGSLAIFFSNPLVGGIMGLALALLILPKLLQLRGRLRRKPAVE